MSYNNIKKICNDFECKSFIFNLPKEPKYKDLDDLIFNLCVVNVFNLESAYTSFYLYKSIAEKYPEDKYPEISILVAPIRNKIFLLFTRFYKERLHFSDISKFISDNPSLIDIVIDRLSVLKNKHQLSLGLEFVKEYSLDKNQIKRAEKIYLESH